MRRDSWYVNYSSDLVEAVFDLRLSLWAGRHNNHDDGALPHVSGPDPSDPCDKKKSCGSCGGKCGWGEREHVSAVHERRHHAPCRLAHFR